MVKVVAVVVELITVYFMKNVQSWVLPRCEVCSQCKQTKRMKQKGVKLCYGGRREIVGNLSTLYFLQRSRNRYHLSDMTRLRKTGLRPHSWVPFKASEDESLYSQRWALRIRSIPVIDESMVVVNGNKASIGILAVDSYLPAFVPGGGF